MLADSAASLNPGADSSTPGGESMVLTVHNIAVRTTPMCHSVQAVRSNFGH
jgi:hypothetical protein